MLVITSNLRATFGESAKLGQLLCQNAFKVHRNEHDTLTYVVHRKIINPSEFFIYEQYRDREAFEPSHLTTTPYYKEAQLILPHLLRDNAETTQYEILDVNQYGNTSKLMG
ncbi:MAG: antibiotic biosynthesis monooxygenase [Dehalococcoidia bacterium]|nr:antibiotic biosynthesis monooxygenase [Dehalococcoidia bacterium]